MALPDNEKWIIFPKNIRIASYTEKGDHAGYKTIHIGVKEMAEHRGLPVEDCVVYQGRIHRRANPTRFIHVTIKDLRALYPDEFPDPKTINEDESYYDN